MSKLSADDKNKMDSNEFGVPEKKMFPLNDKTHIEKANQFFGTTTKLSTDEKKSLAKRILSRAKEEGIDTSNWKQVNTWAGKSNKSVKQEEYIPLSEFDHYFNEGFLFSTNKFRHSDMDLITMINDAIDRAKEMKKKIKDDEWGKTEITYYWKHAKVEDENGKMKKVDSLRDELSEIKLRVQKMKLDYKKRDDNKFNECAEYKNTILTFKMICDAITGFGSLLGQMVDNNYNEYAMHDICEIVDKFEKDSKKFIKVISAS